jgi:hypothetical protein
MHRLPSEHPDEVVPLRVGHHLGPFDERIAAPMARRPGSLPERRIGARERPAAETLV